MMRTDRHVLKRTEIDYTFIVISYNQETVIVQTLESIKYQIETYGKNYQIQLILGDDASTDKTTYVIDQWLMQNNHLFVEIDRLYLKENGGTCRNYVNCIRNIMGKSFREIAGDDILPENNIFVIMDMTEKYDIVAAPHFYFSQGKILKQHAIYRNVFRQGIFSVRQIRILTNMYCPILNGAVWKKELMTEDVLQYISKYTLIEDRPQWYKIFLDNKDLTYLFYDDVSFLYRREAGSVTHSENQVKVIYENDIKNIYRDIDEQSNSFFIKLMLRWNKKTKVCNPLTLWIKLMTLINYSKIKKKYNYIMKMQYDKNQNHLEYIMKISKAFMRDIGYNE